MTSEERRQARRKRREAKRREKKRQWNEKFGKLENVTDYGNLLDAFDRSKQSVRWKCSVQRYEASMLRKTYDTHMKLLAGEDIRRGFHNFTLMERGKLRQISSIHISERVVQRSLSDNALVPILTRTAIYHNMACLKGRGTHKAIQRVAEFLREYYRKHGSNKGVAVLVDFKDFFGRLVHSYIRAILEKHFIYQDMIDFIMLFVEAFGEVGCGLGSQVSQIVGTIYPNRVDHYAKEVLRIRAYLRYMDDTFMLFENKEQADAAMEALFGIYDELGITVNRKKTQKISLKHGFTFLKTQFRLTDTGKVIMRPCRKSIVRERRKLKKLKEKLDKGQIPFEAIRQQYGSWTGYMKHKMSWRTVRRMDQLFNELFIVEWQGKEEEENDKDQVQRNRNSAQRDCKEDSDKQIVGDTGRTDKNKAG